MDNQNSTEVVELETADNLYWVNKADALRRLYDNPDFKSVVLEGYFQDRAVDATSMLAHPSTLHEGSRNNYMEQLVGISLLNRYFQMLINKGTIPDDDYDYEE